MAIYRAPARQTAEVPSAAKPGPVRWKLRAAQETSPGHAWLRYSVRQSLDVPGAFNV